MSCHDKKALVTHIKNISIMRGWWLVTWLRKNERFSWKKKYCRSTAGDIYKEAHVPKWFQKSAVQHKAIFARLLLFPCRGRVQYWFVYEKKNVIEIHSGRWHLRLFLHHHCDRVMITTRVWVTVYGLKTVEAGGVCHIAIAITLKHIERGIL